MSCQTITNNTYTPCYGSRHYSSSLPLPVEGRPYSSVCGRVRGHGYGRAFHPVINCNLGLEEPYVEGLSLSHGLAGRRRHIWTFAAAGFDGHQYTPFSCDCSNTDIIWPHATPDDVGSDYFCDSYSQFTEDDLWDGEGCGPSSSCCDWKDPPYFCKHLHNATSEDMEIRLFSVYSCHLLYYTPTVSLIEIFVK